MRYGNLVFVLMMGCTPSKKEMGPTGSPGEQGSPGTVGPAGEQGSPGEQGPRGPQGLRGPEGERGPQGVAGPQGVHGAAGANGAMGPVGRDGTSCAVEEVEEGAHVVCGSDDAVVRHGEDGERGEMGPRGDQGPQGLQGLVGPVGPEGERGPQGIQGVAGIQGERGPEGPMGLQGLQGIRGERGPEGAVGSVGPAGPQGERGLQGEQGSEGLIGPQGAAGIQGERGPQGEQGLVGPMGLQGPAGADGQDLVAQCPAGSQSMEFNGHLAYCARSLVFDEPQTWVQCLDECLQVGLFLAKEQDLAIICLADPNFFTEGETVGEDVASTPGTCDDGRNNNGDPAMDCDDPACADALNCDVDKRYHFESAGDLPGAIRMHPLARVSLLGDQENLCEAVLAFQAGDQLSRNADGSWSRLLMEWSEFEELVATTFLNENAGLPENANPRRCLCGKRL